jgi:predicted ATP-binding protein involved in virulence
MRVRRIEVENYRGFERLAIDLPLSGPVVLIGENGAGKSSLLRLLAIALERVLAPGMDGSSLSPRDIRRGASSLSVRVEFSDGQSWRVESFDGRLGGRDTVNSGDAPGLPPRPISLVVLANRGVPSTTFGEFIDWFRKTEDVENEVRLQSDDTHREPKLQSVRRALERFVAALPGAEYSRPRFSRVGEWADDGRGTFLVDKRGVTLALDQLSDGEALTLLLVGDLARRLALTGSQDPLAGPGIVLIDEVEQHLHPRWQRALLPALGATFPQVQFIVTTHSPVVLGTIPRENVLWLRDFQRVERMPHTYGRDGTNLLVDVMGVPPHTDDIQHAVDDLALAIDAEDFARARRLLAELEERIGADDPEVIRQRTTLDFLEDEP